MLSEFHASWICSLALSSVSFEMGKRGRGSPSGWVVLFSLTGVGRRLCGIVWMRGVWSRLPPSMGVVSACVCCHYFVCLGIRVVPLIVRGLVDGGEPCLCHEFCVLLWVFFVVHVEFPCAPV